MSIYSQTTEGMAQVGYDAFALGKGTYYQY
jgi:hypothetical protein